MSTDDRNRAWVEVRAAALLRNLRRIRDAAGAGAGVLPMVKANAYGLGAVEVCRLLAAEGVVGFGVASVAEAVELRSAGLLDRIIVFTPLAPGDEANAVDARIEVVAGDVASVARAVEAGLRVHLEIDTGMGRAGLPMADLDGDVVRLRELLADGGRWAGVFTHLHSADEPGAPGLRAQIEEFRRALALLRPHDGVEIHLANSAGVLRDPDLGGVTTHWVRPGIHLYGGGSGSELPTPDAVVAVRARVVRVQQVAPGATVGYGAEYQADEHETWATLAIGYGDGIPRSLSNRGRVLLAGASCPLIGRVSMDMVTANISAVEGVRVGDVATLIGRDGDQEITIDEIAEKVGTIPYEILTRLSPRLPRIREVE